MSTAEAIERRVARALNADELLELDTVRAQKQGGSTFSALAKAGTFWPDIEQGDDITVWYHPSTDSFVIRKAEK